MGRALVREHMQGVYEHLLKGDRLSFARRVSTLWQTQHDTGRLVLVDGQRGRARYELSDFGHPSREMCAVIRGYILEALAHSGFAAGRGGEGGLRARRTRPLHLGVQLAGAGGLGERAETRIRAHGCPHSAAGVSGAGRADGPLRRMARRQRGAVRARPPSRACRSRSARSEAGLR